MKKPTNIRSLHTSTHIYTRIPYNHLIVLGRLADPLPHCRLQSLHPRINYSLVILHHPLLHLSSLKLSSRFIFISTVHSTTVVTTPFPDLICPIQFPFLFRITSNSVPIFFILFEIPYSSHCQNPLYFLRSSPYPTLEFIILCLSSYTLFSVLQTYITKLHTQNVTSLFVIFGFTLLIIRLFFSIQTSLSMEILVFRFQANFRILPMYLFQIKILVGKDIFSFLGIFQFFGMTIMFSLLLFLMTLISIYLSQYHILLSHFPAQLLSFPVKIWTANLIYSLHFVYLYLPFFVIESTI